VPGNECPRANSIQLAGAVDTAHSMNLVLRCLDPSKVLVTGQNRFRVSGCGVLDLLLYSRADANAPSLIDLQQSDLIAFGQLMIVYGMLLLIPLTIKNSMRIKRRNSNAITP
jgi:hypothetical protein